MSKLVMAARLSFSVLAAILVALLVATISGCATERPDTPAVPSWVRGSARSSQNGSIYFVESDDSVDPARAAAGAEALALEDVANECSFVPKGAKITDRYSASVSHLTQIHVQLRVSQSACDAAKKANALDAIQAQGDVAAAERIARFQAERGEPKLDESAAGSDDARAWFVARQKLAKLKQQILVNAKPGAAGLVAREATIRIAALEKEAARLSDRSGQADEIAKSDADVTSANRSPAASSLTWSKYRHELMRPRFGSDGSPVTLPGEKSKTSPRRP